MVLNNWNLLVIESIELLTLLLWYFNNNNGSVVYVLYYFISKLVYFYCITFSLNCLFICVIIASRTFCHLAIYNPAVYVFWFILVIRKIYHCWTETSAITCGFYPRYIGVRSGMATFDLPFPEITVEEFPRAWTRFELVSATKEWKDEKQASILPMLLQGKLVDYYVDLDATTKADLKLLKMTLMKKAGLAHDLLTAGKPGEKAADFTNHLKSSYSNKLTQTRIWPLVFRYNVS